MSILVTGGLGFIGSHCVVELLNENYQIIIVDNLSNSKIEVLYRIQNLTKKKPLLYQIDLQNNEKMEEIFEKHQIDLVIHMAGLKAVAQSVKEPLLYYQQNITMTLTLLSIMTKYHVKKIIFSSSGTVYGTQPTPFDESMMTGIGLSNPYTKTKYIIEEILKDLQKSDYTWLVIILRYFNPSGAHPSGIIGENPNDIPNNLMPILLKIADDTRRIDIKPKLNIYGTDYDTVDGTCIRDYIHVVDLVTGHLAAMRYCTNPGIHTYNLGTGIGYSVRQLVNTFQMVNGIKIECVETDRRLGDLTKSLASVDKARTELDWQSQYHLEDICRDSWKAYQYINNNRKN